MEAEQRTAQLKATVDDLQARLKISEERVGSLQQQLTSERDARDDALLQREAEIRLLFSSAATVFNRETSTSASVLGNNSAAADTSIDDLSPNDTTGDSG